MSSFSMEHDLPEEIINIVVSHCTPAALVALCRCSKRLNRIATPCLYATICFRVKHPRDLCSDQTRPFIYKDLKYADDDENRRATLSSMPWFLPFAHLLLNSPVHAGYVRSLTVEHFEHAKPSPEWAIQQFPQSLERICGRCTANEEDAHALFEFVKSGMDKRALFALLCMHLGNLQRLCLPPNDPNGSFRHGRWESLIRVLRLVAHGQQSESAASRDYAPLDIMFFGGVHWGLPSSTEVVAFLLSRPNIRSLYVWNLGQLHLYKPALQLFKKGMDPSPLDGMGISILQPRSLGLEFVELQETNFSGNQIHHFMGAFVPGVLKTLIYKRDSSSVTVHNEILESLTAHHGTLERLEWPNLRNARLNSHGSIPPVSFQVFTNLRKLKVAPVSIWGRDRLREEEATVQSPSSIPMLRDALPSSLDELWITNVNVEKSWQPEYITDLLLPALSLLISHRNDSFPHLTHVYLSFEIATEYGYKRADLRWLEALPPLALSARKAGITLVINPRYEIDSLIPRPWGWYEDVKWRQWECEYEDFAAVSRRIVVADVDDVLEAVKAIPLPKTFEEESEYDSF